ncbi:hypothetical protein [Streptomyces flavofungini]|uniref:hypothetical protein n=1 Tax=Streptomyces flavofungini TaxID=68200 RepID=UPI0034E0484B
MFGDKRLSLTALGVFAQITSVPVGETFTAADLAEVSSDCLAVAEAGLAELATHGYLAAVAR